MLIYTHVYVHTYIEVSIYNVIAIDQKWEIGNEIAGRRAKSVSHTISYSSLRCGLLHTQIFNEERNLVTLFFSPILTYHFFLFPYLLDFLAFPCNELQGLRINSVCQCNNVQIREKRKGAGGKIKRRFYLSRSKERET